MEIHWDLLTIGLTIGLTFKVYVRCIKQPYFLDGDKFITTEFVLTRAYCIILHKYIDHFFIQ